MVEITPKEIELTKQPKENFKITTFNILKENKRKITNVKRATISRGLLDTKK